MVVRVQSLDQYAHPSIVPVSELAELIQKLRKEGKTVGLCHGGFDLLHPGHIKHFEAAKKTCDVLIVSLTADHFVGGRKGVGRPVYTDKLRAYMIASLAIVDYVTISDWKGGVEIINALQPSFYIKGPDFIGKDTPGINAERAAIAAVGGEMRYTDDPPFSTTAVIKYIQDVVDKKKVLLLIDRDGTIIENDDFLGRDAHWREELSLNKPVVDFLSYLKTKHQPTMMVISNQAGVARGYFDEALVDEINQTVAGLLAKNGILVHSWHYCPDVDTKYADKHPEIAWNRVYVKDHTDRKPNPGMVYKALEKIGAKLEDFDAIYMIGDREDDKGLAENLSIKFIDVKNKTFEELVADFSAQENSVK